MLRVDVKCKVRGKAYIIRKADKDRMKAAARKRAEEEKKAVEEALDEEDRPP